MKAPLTLPTSGMARQRFEIERQDFLAPEASGRIGGVQGGFPRWLAEWTIGRVGTAKSDELRAFWSQLRGALRRFVGRDLARPLPLAHIDGLPVGFDGSATSWSENITADADSELTLHLGAAAAGLVLTPGDYVGFKYDATEASVAGLPWRALVRVVEGATADGSGVVTVVVEPPVPACVPATAIAHLDEPGCIMALVTDKSNLDAIDRRLAISSGTITAVEDLRSGL